MAEGTLNEIIKTTYTKNDFHRKIVFLKEFFSNFFFTEKSSKNLKKALGDFLKNEDVSDCFSKSLTSLGDKFYDSFDTKNYNKLLNELESSIDALPHITIYAPILLPDDEVVKLGKWVRENIKENLVIDLEVDSNVIGGCSFVWNGVYHDYSLRYFIDNNRNEIKKMVRNYKNVEG